MIINDFVSRLAIDFTNASEKGVASVMAYVRELSLSDILILMEYEGQTRDFDEKALAILEQQFEKLKNTPQAKRMAQENGFKNPTKHSSFVLDF